ncbi:unnamed protein product [Schistosoma turkestanicum]|nr:unnamed protein product [Schistosoma turkestanicum]
MLQPDEIDAIEKLNELFEKEDKSDKYFSQKLTKKTHHDHHQHHQHHHHHHDNNHNNHTSNTNSNNHNNNLSSVFRCSETRTFKSPTHLNGTQQHYPQNQNNDNELIPTGLPRIKTKITVKILPNDCCITVLLDPTAKLNTVCAMYDLNEQIIIIGYQRLVTLKTLENLPMKFNAMLIEQNENFNYDLTTYVEHRYKVSLDMYYLNAARVKQKKNIVYIMIPRKLKPNDIHHV